MRRVMLVHYEQTVRGRVAGPRRRMRRVRTCTPIHCEQTVREGVASAVVEGCVPWHHQPQPGRQAGAGGPGWAAGAAADDAASGQRAGGAHLAGPAQGRGS